MYTGRTKIQCPCVVGSLTASGVYMCVSPEGAIRRPKRRFFRSFADP